MPLLSQVPELLEMLKPKSLWEEVANLTNSRKKKVDAFLVQSLLYLMVVSVWSGVFFPPRNILCSLLLGKGNHLEFET